jgi:hypothetical protein
MKLKKLSDATIRDSFSSTKILGLDERYGITSLRTSNETKNPARNSQTHQLLLRTMLTCQTRREATVANLIISLDQD